MSRLGKNSCRLCLTTKEHSANAGAEYIGNRGFESRLAAGSQMLVVRTLTDLVTEL